MSELKYRHKGSFLSYDRARALQQKLKGQGLRAKVVTFTDGYSVYVMSTKEFWGKSFVNDTRRV